jgi:ABC-type Mn2+/Zn2+ transport system ATPase subunit
MMSCPCLSGCKEPRETKPPKVEIVIFAEIRDALAPLLEDTLSDNQVQDLCNCVIRVFKGLSDDGDNEKVDVGESGESAKEDYIIKCDEIVLAVAGKQLLRPSSLRLIRGRRYGFVGQNGVGKSTLLSRIEARDIVNFPDIKVALVRQDIEFDDTDTRVMQYMVSATKGTRSDQEIKTVLTDMGFCVQMLLTPIRELSGGWRMKLTLAGAILSSADMLLLDEPTNHLDSSSIAWLIAYLNTLTTTTLLIVSHDYDFLVSSPFLTPTSVLFDTHFTDFLMHAQRTKSKSTRRGESSRTSCT